MSYKDGKINHFSFSYSFFNTFRNELTREEVYLLQQELIIAEDEFGYRFDGCTDKEIAELLAGEQRDHEDYLMLCKKNPALPVYFKVEREKRKKAITGYRNNMARYNNRKNNSQPVPAQTGEIISPIPSPMSSPKIEKKEKAQIETPVQPEIKEVAPSVSKEETPIAKMEETTPVVVEKKEPSPMDKLMQMEEKEKNVSQPADGDLFDDFEGMMEGWEG